MSSSDHIPKLFKVSVLVLPNFFVSYICYQPLLMCPDFVEPKVFVNTVSITHDRN